MTNLTGTRVQYPIPGLSLTSPGQWRDGEPLDDIKLHQRIDIPLEYLGGKQRSWGSDMATFVGEVGAGGGLTAATNIAFTPQTDTAQGWDAVNNRYVIPYDGYYMISCGLAYTTSASGVFAEIVWQGTGAQPLRGTGFLSTPSGGANTGSTSILCGYFNGVNGINGYPPDIFAGQVNVTGTARGSLDCWFEVRQLSY